jgi:hypothetical protein
MSLRIPWNWQADFPGYNAPNVFTFHIWVTMKQEIA